MEMTIKELADSLGVSKPTISKAIDTLGIQGDLRRVSNRFVLSEPQIEAVKSQILQNTETKSAENTPKLTTNEPTESESETEKVLISSLQSQITMLQEQLSVKDAQIAAMQQQLQTLTDSLHDTTAALTAAQALHAGTIQQQLADKQASHEGQAEERKGFWQRIFKKRS